MRPFFPFQTMMKVAVIGGGAAGFFAAASCGFHHPGFEIVIYEKSQKLLTKVKVSGGGRCNVSHACFNVFELSGFYPRGGKQLKHAFNQFNTIDTVKWFEKRGVKLKTETDNRMFPVTDNSQTIVDCLTGEAQKAGVIVRLNSAVSGIKKINDKFQITFKDRPDEIADKVIVTTGGSPKLEGFDWLIKLGHHIEPPVPSLFTFNMPREAVTSLMGVVVDHATVKVQSTKLKCNGPLLVTHWGMSGPAILKLSSFGARILSNMNYQFMVQINWLGEQKEDEVREQLLKQISISGKRKISNQNPFFLPNRLWIFLLKKIAVNPDSSWSELSKKSLNRIVNVTINDEYCVEGKTTFKEEFVTCGGISLSDINFNTMESKICPGLYFAGEVLDIDGVTGGFNFQAAWTTGFVAGKLSG